MQTLRPRLIELNELINGIRAQAKKDFEESAAALKNLHEVLQQELRIRFKLEPRLEPVLHLRRNARSD